MRTITLHVGMSERIVNEQEIRNAQAALLQDKLGQNDRALIDAVVSDFLSSGKVGLVGFPAGPGRIMMKCDKCNEDGFECVYCGDERLT